MIDSKELDPGPRPLDHTVEVLAESARFTTRNTVRGRVRVQTLTEFFDETVEGILTNSAVEVERKAIGREIEAMPSSRVEGDVTIVPVVEERLVVVSRLFLKEELHIRQIRTTETVAIPVTVRRQRAVVDHLPPASTNPSGREPMTPSTSTSSRQIVTAFFDDRSEADSAIERIVAEGISRGEIKIVAGTDTSAAEASSRPAKEKGFFEAIGDFFMPDEDRHAYAEGLQRGGYLVTVPTSADNRDRVLDILDDEGTVNMDEREQSWRSEGWSGLETGYDAERAATAGSVTRAAGAYASVGTGRDVARDGRDHEGTLDVVEEDLRVGKRDVSHGRVRVRSYLVEDDVSQDVNLRDETVDISRRAVDRPVDGFDGAFQDRTIEMEETSQEPVVSKQARVVEEIDLTRDVRDRTETVSDTVRRTEVEIEDDRVAGGKTLTSEERARRGL